MNTKHRNILVASLVSFACCCLTNDAVGKGRGKFGAGARRHIQHSMIEDLPYDDGDISYGLVYEHHEGAGMWQVGLNYAPEPGTNGIDYVLTPQLNLVMRDNAWMGGLGVLGSLVEPEEGDGEWTDIYYQFMTGLEFPLAGFNIEAFVYYTFDDWAELQDFDTDDLDFGALVTFDF